MSTDPESRGGFGPYLEGVGPTYEDEGQVQYIRFGEISDLKRALEVHGSNVAAFLIEPIQGEAGYAELAIALVSFWPNTIISGSSYPQRAILRRCRSCARHTTFC